MNDHINPTMAAFLWFAPKPQAERRCYVCNATDTDPCHGIDGEAAECPRVRRVVADAQARDQEELHAKERP